MPSGNSPLDVEAAYDYACSYATSNNPGYFSYANDAANFASQLLAAGGVLPSQGRPSHPTAWWTRAPEGSAPPQHAESWASVGGLYRFLIGSGIAVELPTNQQDLADTQAGDLIFWDWAPVGSSFDDVGMIVSGDGSDPATELFVSHANEGAGGSWSPIGGMHSMADLLDDRVGPFLHSLTQFNTTKYGSTGSCPSSDPGSGGRSGQCWRWRIVRFLSRTRDGHSGPTHPRETGGGWNPSEAPCQPCDGDPVNTATGEFTEQMIDLEISGRGPRLAVSRTYGAHAAASSGRFGHGWSDAYGMSLYPDPVLPDVMDVEQENGAISRFTLQPDGTWEAPSRVFATLREHQNGTWTFTRADASFFNFDANGRLTKQSDRNGYEIAMAYDGSGRLATVTDDAGLALTFSYSGQHVTQVTASGGRTVRYRYDGNGDLVEFTDVVGNVSSYAYDASHRMTSFTSPNGGTTTNVYDSADRVIEQTGPLGYRTRWAYALDDTTSGTSTVTSPEGVVTLQTYVAGNIVAETLAYGTADAATTRYEYDPVTNRPSKVTDPLGNVTTSTYDADGNRTSRTDERGYTTFWTYDSYGQVTSLTPPATYGGRVSTTYYRYDEPLYSSGGAGNITTVTSVVLDSTGASQGSQTTHFEHGDPAHPGDVTAMVDPAGERWSYTYDTMGNKTSEAAPATSDNAEGPGSRQNVFKWTYKPYTNLVATEMTGRYTLAHPSHTTCAPPAVGCTTNTYDAAGRVLVTTNGRGNTTTNHYDGNGNVDYSIDGNGERTEYEYDRADQLISVVSPSGAERRTRYTPDGLVSHRIDGNGDSTAYTYDPHGTVSSVTDPRGRTTTYKYDGSRKPVTVAEPGAGTCTPQSTNAGCTVYTHDAAGNLTGIDYNDPGTANVSFAFDANGRRTSMTDGTGTTSWTFDSLDRTTESTNGAGATVSYGYDLRGDVTSIDYPGAAGTVTRSYDPAGRIASITNWEQNTTTFLYDADGNLADTSRPTSGAPVVDSVAHDADGNISSIATTQGSTTLASFDYDRDSEAKVVEVDATGVPSGDSTYTYDRSGRLDSADSLTYEYDDADHLTKLPDGTTQTFDAAGQLIEIRSGATTLELRYNAKGQRIEGGASALSASTYDYDQAGRLTVVRPTASGPTYTYEYDGDGLRTGKTVGGATEEFTWDRVTLGVPVMLSDGSASYVYGPDGTPLERIEPNGDTLRYHHDQLGSTRLLTDDTGSVVGTTTFDAFGQTVAATGITTPLGYTGEYTDAETGLVYLRARFYDPATGQFLTRDPAEVVTWEPYGYVSGDPLNATDPSGLCPLASVSRKKKRCGSRGIPYGVPPCYGPPRPAPNEAKIFEAVLHELARFNVPDPGPNMKGFQREPAQNGKGFILKEPGSPLGGSEDAMANAIRVMEGQKLTPNGSLTYYNHAGKPINPNSGRTLGGRGDYHVEPGHTGELRGFPRWWTD